MNFKDKWVDKVDGIDDVLADDVNLLATGIKEAIEKAEDAGKNADIKDLSITTKKIADGAVTLEKLADDAKIINNASGDNIALSDSAESNLRGMRMFGRTEHYTYGYQLFDANDLIGGNANLDGASLNVNKDGSFTITNNKSQNAHFNYTNYIAVKSIFKTGKALSLKVYGATNVEVTLGFSDYGDIGIDGTFISNRAGGQDSFELTQSILDNAASLTVLMDGTLDGSASETIKIMLYQDGDGTWEPFTGGIPAPTTEFPCKLVSVGDDGSVDVNVHGYQLFDQLSLPSGGVNNAVQVVNNGDGSFDVSNPNERGSTYSYELKHDAFVRLFKTGKVTITGGGDDNSYAVVVIRYNNDVDKLEVNTFKGESRSIVIPDNVYNDPTAYVVFGIYSKPRTGSITIKPMVYQDGDGTYEPFKPIQTLTIPTPNGLPAVPVSSNGNYTDANGQQWVCDEIDFNRGVYVQRVNEYVVAGSENWVVSTVQNSTDGRIRFDSSFAGLAAKATGDRCLCTHWVFNGINPRNVESVWVASKGLRILTNCFSTVDELKIALKAQYNSGTPVTVKYPIATPIETPLSEAEINAYKELHTHYPHTSIHNSDNAHMAVDYVADTKNYVDNKIKKEVAELTAAILTQ